MKNTLILEVDIGDREMVNVLVLSGMRAKYRKCNIYVQKESIKQHKLICEINYIDMDYQREHDFITKATDNFLKYLTKYEDGVCYVKAKVKRN